MALVRYRQFNPLYTINDLRQQMNQMLEEFNLATVDNGFIPSAEMEATADDLHLRLELPGIDPNGLDIQVSNDSISISGERRQEQKTEDNGLFRSEFRYGRFQRVIGLPVRVKNTDVKAEYKDGILHITLPKADEERTKVVRVNVNSVA